MATALAQVPTNDRRVTTPPAATAVVARASSDGLPSYVTAEEARRVIDAAETTRDRLLLETLWQTGGRVSEVARLRRGDVDPAEGALRLVNLKQKRRALAAKLVYVGSGLVAALLAFANDARVPPTGSLFRSRQGGGMPMTRQNVWQIVTRCALRAGVRVVGRDGELRPATGLDFRHGAAVHQLRASGPLSEVSQQLGHARIDTTTISTRLTNVERRRYADRVAW
jgi:integrase/recombinase XerD